MTPELALILDDPAWFPHRYDPQHDAFQFIRLDRSRHAEVAFLTDQALGAQPRPLVVPRIALRDWQRPAPGQIHFLFHSAFCCSTLIARAFDHPGLAMGLKEPTILNDLVGLQRRTGRPCPRDLLSDTLDLLARPFAPGEMVLVKPSNVVNVLSQPILQILPQANALLLHAPLRTFLLSVAKKGLWGRLWVRELFLGMLKDGPHVALGFGDEQLFGQTDLQIAALGWLAQQAAFGGLVAEFGAQRVRSLDSETLLSRPPAAMRRLAGLFGLGESGAAIDSLAASPAFRRHSKLEGAFDTAAREAEYRETVERHGDEIDKVLAWATQVAATHRIALNLPAPLLP